MIRKSKNNSDMPQEPLTEVRDFLPFKQRKISAGWGLHMPKVKIKGGVISKKLIRLREKERS